MRSGRDRLLLSGGRVSDRAPPGLLADTPHGPESTRRVGSGGNQCRDHQFHARSGPAALGASLLAWLGCHLVRRGQPIGPDAPTPAQPHDDHGDGGDVRRRLWNFRRQSLLRPTPAPVDLAGSARRRRRHRVGSHRRSSRLRSRSGAHRSPGRHPDPAPLGSGNPVGGGRRALGGGGRAGPRRSSGSRLHRRPVFGGSTDTGALRRRAGDRPTAGTGGGHGDERPASGDPFGARLLRGDRRSRRLARRYTSSPARWCWLSPASSIAGCRTSEVGRPSPTRNCSHQLFT